MFVGTNSSVPVYVHYKFCWNDKVVVLSNDRELCFKEWVENVLYYSRDVVATPESKVEEDYEGSTDEESENCTQPSILVPGKVNNLGFLIKNVTDLPISYDLHMQY